MRDQIIAIYVIPFVAQVTFPLALLAWLVFGREANRLAWLIKTLSVSIYLVAIAIGGLWLIVPWYTSVAYLLVLAGGTIYSWQRLSLLGTWPQDSWGGGGLALRAALAMLSAALLVLTVSARQIPSEEVVDLTFPLRNGTYYVVGGGSNASLNPHVQTLKNDRFVNYRGQSFGIDIVKINRFGLRASGFVSRDPQRYFIFGEPAYAPCSGMVIRAEDGFPDMPPPQPDREHLTGNYVLLECGGRQIMLGHFRRESIRVRAGDRVEEGAMIAEVGNSGNSGEPHLHIHAQRPARTSAFMSGDPRPIRFDGRFPVRNDWVNSPARKNSRGVAPSVTANGREEEIP